jgi:flagellar biosynthetic protein FliR
MFLLIPGIGAAQRGIAAKYSAILMFSLVSMYSSATVPLPTNLALMAGMILSEMALGACIGLIPLLMIAALQNAGQIASTSMGLQAGAVMDPSTGISVSELSKIFGDLFMIAFLYVNAHHVLIMAASGLNGRLIPGSFLIGESSLEFVIQRSADIFMYGLLFASPVVVALLLTNFVMGLVSKAVPTVNIFIVSFPLTIGIGLILTLLMIPELMKANEKVITSTDSSVSVILQDATLK